MKFNPKLKEDIEKFKDCVILVEGKNDVASLKNAGFDKVYAIHKTGVGLRERIEGIVLEVGRDKVFCILMDSDKPGRELYKLAKTVLQELGVRIDTKFRGLLSRENVSHLEGFGKFMKKISDSISA